MLKNKNRYLRYFPSGTILAVCLCFIAYYLGDLYYFSEKGLYIASFIIFLIFLLTQVLKFFNNQYINFIAFIREVYLAAIILFVIFPSYFSFFISVIFILLNYVFLVRRYKYKLSVNSRSLFLSNLGFYELNPLLKNIRGCYVSLILLWVILINFKIVNFLMNSIIILAYLFILFDLIPRVYEHKARDK